MDFAVQTDQRVKTKRYRKRDNYLDLARELKKLWNIKVTVIQIVTGALRTIPKGLVSRLEELEGVRAVTIQTTALLRSDRVLRQVLKT